MERRFLPGLLVLAAVIAISVPAAAQAQDTWIGTWKLNLAKSKYDPANLAPKSQVIKQEAVAGGGMKATVDVVDAQGKSLHQENMTMFDGKSSEVKGAPDANTTRVYKRIDNRTYEYVQSVGGKLTVTSRTAVAADGKTRTVTTTGKNAQGQTVNNVAAYDSKMGDPMLRGRVSISRRDLLRLVGTAAGAGVVEAWFHTAHAFGQPGAWYAARSPDKVTFPKGSVIRTILKDIPPDQMPNGSVQIHEHVTGVFTRTPPPAQPDMVPGVVAPANEAEYLALMIEELKMAKADGLGCLVDAASNQRRTDQTVENMRKISSGSNVPIVLGGGYYQDLAIPARYPDDMVTLSEDALTDQLIRDAASQHWGSFGEIASSQTMQPEERRLIRAIGRAHVKAKLPIFTHTPHQSCPSCAIEQLDVFESVGVDPRRVCIGHLTAIRPEAEPLAQTAKAIAKRGAFLGFDTVGHLMGRSAIPEAHKVKYVLAVLDAGYEDNLLLSADSTPPPQLKANWGQGYGSVIAQFAPKLRYAGVKDALLHKILVDNPRRFLAFVPPSAS